MLIVPIYNSRNLQGLLNSTVNQVKNTAIYNSRNLQGLLNRACDRFIISVSTIVEIYKDY